MKKTESASDTAEAGLGGPQIFPPQAIDAARDVFVEATSFGCPTAPEQMCALSAEAGGDATPDLTGDAQRPADNVAGPRERRSLIVSAIISVSVHCAFAALAVFAIQRASDPGSAGQVIEAIEISLVASEVIESRTAQSEQAAAAPMQPTTEESQDSEKTAAPAKPSETDGSPEDAMLAATPPPEQSDESLNAVADPPRSEPPPSQSPASAQSGVSARPPVQGAAAASAGEMNRFASQVRATLGRNKPRVQNLKGTLVIAFTIARDGAVAQARIDQSSGQDRLDQIVLNAVRKIVFPPPPPSASDRQRTFVVPFRIR